MKFFSYQFDIHDSNGRHVEDLAPLYGREVEELRHTPENLLESPTEIER